MRIKVVGLIAIAFSSSIFAISNSPEEFFYRVGYQKGYKQGYENGYKAGYKQAVEDFKTILKAYKDDIKALEEGKYLVKEGYITAPRLYRIRNSDGTITFKVVGCRIERLRNLEDIIKNPFVVPVIDKKTVEKVRKASERLITIPQLPNSQPNVEKVQVYLIPVSKQAKDILNKLGIPYEIDPQSGKVKAIFFDEKRMNEFCQKYKLCY